MLSGGESMESLPVDRLGLLEGASTLASPAPAWLPTSVIYEDAESWSGCALSG